MPRPKIGPWFLLAAALAGLSSLRAAAPPAAPVQTVTSPARTTLDLAGEWRFALDPSFGPFRLDRPKLGHGSSNLGWKIFPPSSGKNGAASSSCQITYVSLLPSIDQSFKEGGSLSSVQISGPALLLLSSVLSSIELDAPLRRGGDLPA
jgi:hypothetical protein